MAEQKIRNAYKNFMFKFSPFLNSSKNVGNINLIDDKTVSDFSPKRFNFYSQVMESIVNSNPEIVKRVFNLVNLSKHKIKKMQKSIRDIKSRIDKTNILEIKRIIDTEMGVDSKPGDDANIPVGNKPTNPPEKIASILRDIRDAEAAEGPAPKGAETAAKGGGADKTFNSIFSRYQDDPELSPDIDKVDFRDRAIFIVLTFIIRSMALFMTEWSIYSGYINTFSQSFNMYFGIYTSIFILVLILTNANNEDITFFKQLFYYVNAEAENGKGIIRIIAQITCIFFIIPIPYMVKDFRLKDKSQNSVLTYTQKSNIYYSVDKFSLYTWILTSIVAMSL